MQQERKSFIALLERFRQGTVSPPERSKLFRWLINLNLIGQKLSEQHFVEKQKRSWQELESIVATSSPIRVLRFPVWLKTAAAVLLLLSAYGLWHYQQPVPMVQTAMRWVETSTATGEIKHITLSDGTLITLNSQSTLRYPLVFEGKQRKVFLSGQGFFEVVHHRTKPFLVKSANLQVQVLGTSFDVKAYPNDPDHLVDVASGRVGVMANVNGKPQTVFLDQGKGLVYELKNSSILLTEPAVALVGNWQSRHLVYKNVALSAITRDLERQFKVTFIFKNAKIRDKRLSLDMKAPKLDILMKALSLSGNFQYKMDKNNITLW